MQHFIKNITKYIFMCAVTVCFVQLIEGTHELKDQLSKKNLLKVFPKLYEDLSNGIINTLDAYVIYYPHNKVLEPTSELCNKILNEMCLHAAQVFDCQTGREHGFGNFCLSNPPITREKKMKKFWQGIIMPLNQ